ncbi:protein of unknown function [Cupriavidus taiwanensis]|uniref:Uncharacterized protein n=1 Tax=Cupriavidus taiwanensis TaxID=164546 RepID=A0A375ICF7_9BURK|nr:protein of unknown function [Cupriavidus taiwanensis]
MSAPSCHLSFHSSIPDYPPIDLSEEIRPPQYSGNPYFTSRFPTKRIEVPERSVQGRYTHCEQSKAKRKRSPNMA